MKTFNQYVEMAGIEMHREIFMGIAKKLDSSVKDIESLPEIYAIQFKGEVAKLKEMAGNFRYLSGL
jgi:hypothetical protein